LKYGALPRDVYRRREAVMALSEAGSLENIATSGSARDAAIEANRLSPTLVPAAAMAAHAFVAKDQKKQATRAIKKAWDAEPHPDLAAAFAAIEPDEDPNARLRRFGVLTRSNPDHPESKMLDAELKIAAEDFPGARRALGDLYETDPTVRTAMLMAAIERGEGADDSVVKAWLAKAVTSPRGMQWVCSACQNVQASWTAICESCGGFDTLTWTRAPDSDTNLPGGAGVLPLLIGSPEANRDDDTIDSMPVVVNGEDTTNDRPNPAT
jgi:HemY protein